MSDGSAADRGFGSAAGIPGPPERALAERGPTVTATRARRGRRWAWLLILVPIGIVAALVGNRSSSSDTSAIDALRVGDCFTAPSTASFAASKIDVVDCATPHTREVYAIGTSETAIGSTADADQNPDIVRVCRTDVDRRILEQLATTTGVTPGVVANLDRPGRLVCTADSAVRTGSLVAASTS